MLESDHTTIAFVSGFLVNMLQGRLQLVTPVPGSERWPLGYRVLSERFFRRSDEFREGLQRMIDQHVLEAGNRCFHLRSRNMEHRVLDDIAPTSVGHLIAYGNCTASELVRQVTTDGTSVLAVADLLDQLCTAGGD
ncbi:MULTISPECIES: hypothetical protein [unclassified Bradyrhizobium]|uniref:hypothetical protein n=1 Tax=unclassified Bradyrhizobium TaxID=2631580 RepID=UPI001CD59681|nr:MULTISPECIES: hypothetical protein [unclassified Bradyrhizobium]